jgi:hypothetical protein
MLLTELETIYRSASYRLPEQHLGQAHRVPQSLGAILRDA